MFMICYILHTMAECLSQLLSQRRGGVGVPKTKVMSKQKKEHELDKRVPFFSLCILTFCDPLLSGTT